MFQGNAVLKITYMNIHEKTLIYFVQGESTKLIKIGKTNSSIEERVSSLQTGSPDILNVIGITFEPYNSESNLHAKFNLFRKHGEWFSPEDKITLFVQNNCFKKIQIAYRAYPLVLSGAISYDEAVAMSEKKLIELSKLINYKSFDTNGIYKI